MKCPKCQYLGFDGQSRCRNCGYDLSLASTLEVPPAAGRSDAGPPTDVPAGRPRGEPSAREQARAAIQRRAGTRTPAPDFDLPLFATPGADDRPALALPPRPPLSVRRTTSDGPRARAAAAAAVVTPLPEVEPAAQEPDPAAPAEIDPRLDLPLARSTTATPPDLGDADLAMRLDEPPTETPSDASAAVTDPATVRLAAPPVIAPRREAPGHGADERPAEAATVIVRRDVLAGAGSDDGRTLAAADADVPAADTTRVARRVAAGLVDLLLLIALDALVVLATLRVLALPLTAVDRLPLAPLVVFFGVLAVGYLTMCTVLAGQTLGKHLFGLRVVEPEGRPVRFGHAVVRAGVQVLTVPLLGVGFLPALLGADRRTLYDRLSGTEVVNGRS